MYQVNLAGLRRRPSRLTGNLEASELGIETEDARLDGPLSLDLELAFKGSWVEGRGELSGRVKTACRRCLEPLDLEVRAGLDLRYRLLEGPFSGPEADPEGEEEEAEDEEEGGDGELKELGPFDLAPGLRDCFLLACPANPLCKQDCKGLCPRCGTNWNLERCDCEEERT